MDEKNQEPSMEDILASIRKILSEDEEEPAAKAPAPAPKPAPMPEPEPEPSWDMTPEPEPEPEVSWDDALQEQVAAEDDAEDEVFELTDSMVAEEEEEPLLLQPAPPPPPVVEEVEDELETIWRPEPAAPVAVAEDADRLVSAPTEAKSAAAFSELALIARERTLGVGTSGLTIEGLVRDMVRPLLTEWLDNHLPDLVERLVRKEIERLVSGDK